MCQGLVVGTSIRGGDEGTVLGECKTNRSGLHPTWEVSTHVSQFSRPCSEVCLRQWAYLKLDSDLCHCSTLYAC